MVLANSYVSLATFVTPEELQVINFVKESLNNPDSVNKEDHDRAIEIYNRVLADIDLLKDEVSKIDFI